MPLPGHLCPRLLFARHACVRESMCNYTKVAHPVMPCLLQQRPLLPCFWLDLSIAHHCRVAALTPAAMPSFWIRIQLLIQHAALSAWSSVLRLCRAELETQREATDGCYSGEQRLGAEQESRGMEMESEGRKQPRYI
eukprot:364239-Chlamydomonas_euryale.AAC.1